MRIYRETLVKAGNIQISDKTEIEIDEKLWPSTAVHRDGDNVIFFTDDIICRHRMNPKNTTEGGYDKTELREYLKELAEKIPESFRDRMRPFDNGDYLRPLSLQEMFGLNEKWENVGGQWKWFEKRRNRVSYFEDELEWYWLRGVASATAFACVDGEGDAYYCGASSAWGGVRPAFAIFDPLSPPLVGGDDSKDGQDKNIKDSTGEIIRKMCDKYCKWPAIWDKEIMGMTLEDSGICDECPLNDLEV